MLQFGAFSDTMRAMLYIRNALRVELVCSFHRCEIEVDMKIPAPAPFLMYGKTTFPAVRKFNLVQKKWCPYHAVGTYRTHVHILSGHLTQPKAIAQMCMVLWFLMNTPTHKLIFRMHASPSEIKF